MVWKRLKNLVFGCQAFQYLEDLEDGSMEDLLRYAQLEFEVFNSELVKKAAVFAIKSCKGKKILDGCPVIDYVICTAILLASSSNSEAVVASGLLLLDSLNDTKPCYQALKLKFGREVAGLVRDVSKLSKLSRISREEKLRDSKHMQDSILDTVQDDRAVMIKIAERTVQMIALDTLDPEKKQKFINETLHVYAPLSERLSFNLWKCQLENLSSDVSDDLKKSYENVTEYDEDGTPFKDKLEKALEKENLPYKHVEFHKKSLRSIQNKMSRKITTFSKIRDKIGLRIIVENEQQCYEAKYVVEHLWEPELKFEKDYIKCPKPDGYRSLHVIVKNAKDQYMEVQIRTDKMHMASDDAHWLYKGGNLGVPEHVKAVVEFAHGVNKHTIERGILYTDLLDGSMENLLRHARLQFQVFNTELVQNAANFAIKSCKGKVIDNLIATAILLASSFDSDIIVASGFLLHGSLCDTKPRYKALKREFGSEVAKLVRDVSKLSKLKEISGKEPMENSELLPDLILAMGVDARAVAIKIAERTVQMIVLDTSNPVAKQRFVNEILRAYIPLSERLGFNSWKHKLENLCACANEKFKESYESISENDKDGIAFKVKLEDALNEGQLPYVRVEFRKKSMLSLRKKMSTKKLLDKKSENKEIDIFEIKDIIGMRIIIEDRERYEAKDDVERQQAKEVVLNRCYQAKDVVEKLWELEYVKDFIKTPKEDGYKSLHVIVKNPNDHHMEVQIRTNKMHKKFNDGHWVYKEGKVPEHVIMLVEMARLTIKQERKVPVYIFVEEEKEVTIEQHPAGTQLKDLCLERGLKRPLKGRVLVNGVHASPNYTLKVGDIIKLTTLFESDSSANP